MYLIYTSDGTRHGEHTKNKQCGNPLKAFMAMKWGSLQVSDVGTCHWYAERRSYIYIFTQAFKIEKGCRKQPSLYVFNYQTYFAHLSLSFQLTILIYYMQACATESYDKIQ